ncbi:MAG TPA: hypothetical protein VII72_14900 [Myxococcota bacterium]
MPWSEQGWGRGLLAGFTAAAAIGLLAYPFFVEGLIARFGVRASCGALLVVSLASLALRRRARWELDLPAWPGPAIAGVLALGAISGRGDALLLIPAIVYLGLADLFRRSLSREDSLIERAARWIVPEAPDFIRGYCRGVTGLWAALFAASAVAIAGLALAGSGNLWQAVTGWGIYALMLGVCGLEFFVRKTWFRYYFHGGPFDRFWSSLFPAENTERGRRSAAYIQRYREEAAQSARARG